MDSYLRHRKLPNPKHGLRFQMHRKPCNYCIELFSTELDRIDYLRATIFEY